MGIFSSIVASFINQHRTKKLINRIQIQNELRKNITEYQPSAIEAFFDLNEPLVNTVISGGQNESRSRAVVASSICSYNAGVPVIILHESNKLLEKKMHSTFGGTNSIVIVNVSNPVYDPFKNLSNNEISSLIINSTNKTYQIQPAGIYYINGITEFIRAKKIHPYCDMYLTCPYGDLFEKIDEAEQTLFIQSSDANSIKSLLMQGQTERSNVETFFSKLQDESNGIIAKKINLNNAVSIKNVVDLGGIIMVDVQTSTNTLMLNIMINEVVNTLKSGREIMLVVDSISVVSNKFLEEVIKSNSSKCITVLSSEDIYAMFGSDESLFNTVVANSKKSIVFKHNTGVSSSKWAEIFGYYEKNEISNTIGSNSSHRGGYGYGTNNSFNVTTKREYIIKPEEISRMNQKEVYIVDCNNGKLIHTEMI